MPLDLNFFADNGDYDNVLTLSLRARQPGVNAAPAPVWFECLTVDGTQADGPANGQVYDPQSHRVVYVWNFGDQANKTPSTASVLNMPTEWKDLNCAYGRKVVHVYKTGRVEPYTVTCYAYEPQTKRFGSETITVQIGDPDEIFANSRTVIYNPGGVADTSAYPNATVVTSNWAGVKAARGAVGGNGRILIAPGVSLSEQLFRDDRWDNIRIGPLDPLGPKFILNAPDPGAFAFTETIIHDADPDASELVVYGARFQGAWDSTTETGKSLNPFYHSKFTQGAPGGVYSFVLSDCDFNGWNMVNPPRVSGTDVALQVIHECTITNWQNYGAQGSTARRSAAFLGCSIFQHPDALSGGAKNQLYNNHGPIRDFGSLGQVLIVSACDLFSRNGWFPGAGGTDLQPALRLNTNGITGAEAFVDRLCAEGPIDLTEQNSTRVDVAMNAVFDKLLTIRGSKGMFEVLNLTYGGVTVRNWLAVQLDAPVGARNLGGFVHIDTRDTNAEGLASPVEFHNITALDLRTDANANNANFVFSTQTTDADGPFQNLLEENIILHQPHRTGVTNGSAPIDITTIFAGVVSRDKGPRFNFLHEGGSGVALVGDLPNGASLPEIPYSEIRDTRYNGNFDDTGASTDQAYWQTHLGGRSCINIHTAGYGTVQTFHDDRNEISVTLSATGITITNTSGATWAGDRFWSLRLDRASALPSFNPAFDTQGVGVPIPRPFGTSAALTSGNRDVFAYDDLLGASPRSGTQTGAILIKPN